MASLLFMKWREGRMPYFPRERKVMTHPQQEPSSQDQIDQPETPSDEGEKDIKGLPAAPQVMNKNQ